MLPTSESVDVVVVGAGLSGLRAAVYLHHAGNSVIVLEARDRVGGKTLSLDASSMGGKVDLGAAWINDTNQSEMYKLAKAFGFDLVEQRTTGDTVRQNTDGTIDTMPYVEGDLSGVSRPYDITKLYEAIMEWTPRAHPEQPHLSPHAAELDTLSFAEYAKKICETSEEVKEASALTAALLGVSAEETSALYILDYIQSGTGFLNMISDGKDGGQYLRNRQGNQTFSIKLASRLPANAVRLSEPVSSITQKSQEGCLVQVKSLGLAYRAKRVIVSVPTCTLPTITFEPPLPSEKQALAESTALGYYAKTIFVFDRPWWHEADLSGVITSEDGPIAFSRDTCVPQDKQYSITCFIVGESGRKWSKWPTRERSRLVKKQFDATIAHTARSKGVAVPEPVNVIEKEWIKDPWSFGAPSPVCMAGVLTSDAGKAMRAPVGSIHFVGTETSTVWKGYMEGAVRSGVRGAKEVVDSFAIGQVTSARLA